MKNICKSSLCRIKIRDNSETDKDNETIFCQNIDNYTDYKINIKNFVKLS